MGEAVPSDPDLDREFAFTPWRGSCRDPYLSATGELRQCRRPRGHEGPHASGFREERQRWADEAPDDDAT